MKPLPIFKSRWATFCSKPWLHTRPVQRCTIAQKNNWNWKWIDISSMRITLKIWKSPWCLSSGNGTAGPAATVQIQVELNPGTAFKYLQWRLSYLNIWSWHASHIAGPLAICPSSCMENSQHCKSSVSPATFYWIKLKLIAAALSFNSNAGAISLLGSL